MGVLLSRFRKKTLSSKEILEILEQDIKEMTERRRRNMYQEKNFIGYLLLLSFLSYLIGALIFYVYYRPHNWVEYGLYSIPLVLFPIIVYLVKKLLNMYFAHKKAQYDQELSNLQEEKRKVLNEVMENETFNVARELLQRYDPQHPSLRATRERRDQGATPQQRGGGELRQRRSAQTPHPALLHQQHTVTLSQTVPRPTRPTPHPPILPPSQPAQPALPTTAPSQVPQTSQVPQSPGVPQTSQVPQSPGVPSHHTTQFIPPGMCLGPAPGPPTPSPILPRERSGLDKMVEYLVGDGPNNRYALVCASCHSHNGMALRDEFEYISFRCAYCFTLNPARRRKPVFNRTLTPLSLPSDSARDPAAAVRGGGGGGEEGEEEKMEDDQRNGSSTAGRQDQDLAEQDTDTAEPAVTEDQPSNTATDYD